MSITKVNELYLLWEKLVNQGTSTATYLVKKGIKEEDMALGQICPSLARSFRQPLKGRRFLCEFEVEINVGSENNE